jgi:hypothetical protein
MWLLKPDTDAVAIDHLPASPAQAPSAEPAGSLTTVTLHASKGRRRGAHLRPVLAFWWPLIAGTVLVWALTAAALVVSR